MVVNKQHLSQLAAIRVMAKQINASVTGPTGSAHP